jgi:hypothetical protein
MARFGILLIALFAFTGWLMSLYFRTAPERNALILSAILAGAVQMTAFWLVIYMKKNNAALFGWLMGIILRGLVLGLYGLVFAKKLGLPLPAALLSFAVYLFASMLLETQQISYAR